MGSWRHDRLASLAAMVLAACTQRVLLTSPDAGAVRDGSMDGSMDAGADATLDAGADGGACAEPLTHCGEACVDLLFDPDHCSECARSCPEVPEGSHRARACDRGECVAPCVEGYATCIDVECQSLDSLEHCGRCGRTCEWSCRDRRCDDATAVGAGRAHTCALRESGEVVCVGANGAGQLGDGTREDRATPVRVELPERASAIAVGGDFACAIGVSGRLFCWGQNDRGQLGDGTELLASTPALVDDLDVVIHVASGRAHACATRATGEVWCWGANDAGQLGDGSTLDRARPVRSMELGEPTATLAAGAAHTCAILESGTVRCWGATLPSPLDATRVVRIAAGAHHTCAITVRSILYCWGDNTHGQLGVGSTDPQSTAVRVGAELSGGAIELALGALHTCALFSYGVRCWGANTGGQLADGSNEDRWAPSAPLPRLPTDIIGGLAAGAAHTCIVIASSRDARFIGGRVDCAGANARGQLGDGTTTPRTSLTPMMAP